MMFECCLKKNQLQACSSLVFSIRYGGYGMVVSPDNATQISDVIECLSYEGI